MSTSGGTLTCKTQEDLTSGGESRLFHGCSVWLDDRSIIAPSPPQCRWTCSASDRRTHRNDDREPLRISMA